jgi:hypothetical protein
MRGVSQETLNVVEGMSIDELIEMIEDFGFTAEALSNEELNQLAISILDGHDDTDGDPEELDFSMDFKQDAYHGD